MLDLRPFPGDDKPGPPQALADAYRSDSYLDDQEPNGAAVAAVIAGVLLLLGAGLGYGLRAWGW